MVSAVKRLSDLVSCRRYDLVFIHVESFPFGPAICEWFFTKLGIPIIYDFEDAIYLKDFKGGNWLMNLLRCPGKFYKTLVFSSQVIVCNRYTRDLVSHYNRNVTVIPTAIDTDKFTIREYGTKDNEIVIGWIGTRSTVGYLKALQDVFVKLSKKYNFVLKIIGGGKGYAIPGVKIINQKWSLEKEVENFQGLDIGLYPLPDDERSLAKTPFKTIQYMSVGVPVVASSVGGNNDIIKDGVNGYLAASSQEWIDKISLLIEDDKLRRRIGVQGRQTVEEKYSLSINAPKFIELIMKFNRRGGS